MNDTPIIFTESLTGRYAASLMPQEKITAKNIDKKYLREKSAMLPEVSELDVERHFTRLSQKNFSIATHFYPLGSCTMKYNPRILQRLVSLPEFINKHPYSSAEESQGTLECLYELQNYLLEITGMKGVALSPMAGAQGEFAGVAMIRAYHEAKGDKERTEIIIPDAAHGTNPASASMCNFTVREIPTKSDGDVDLDALKAIVGPKTAGIMLTNPSTLGVFERNIIAIAKIVHDAGGLLYYDGANLNAILGIARPGDMGFDVMHMNLHKTFATPHGGGGPGSGPIAVSERLLPFMPLPIVAKKNDKYIPLANRISGLAQIDSSSLEVPRGGDEKATGVYLGVNEDGERGSQQSGQICSGANLNSEPVSWSCKTRCEAGQRSIKPKCEEYIWLTEKDCPRSIGYLSAFAGNIGISLQAYIYIRLLGKDGLKKVGEISTLNANYLMKCLEEAEFSIPYSNRRASHEFIVTLKKEAKEHGISAKDFGKRLLDYGVHTPTTYFPLLIPECLLIEPTETESKQTIDKFVVAMKQVLHEVKTDSQLVKNAPLTMPIKRLDDVKAVKDMDFVWNAF